MAKSITTTQARILRFNFINKKKQIGSVVVNPGEAVEVTDEAYAIISKIKGFKYRLDNNTIVVKDVKKVAPKAPNKKDADLLK